MIALLALVVAGRAPLELVCAAKALAHWIAVGLPLVAATPVLGLLLNLDAASTLAVALTLLAGTPALTFTRIIRAALGGTRHPVVRCAWCGVGLASGRLAAGGSGGAAVDSGPDFRGRRLGGRDLRTLVVRNAVFDT